MEDQCSCSNFVVIEVLGIMMQECVRCKKRKPYRNLYQLRLTGEALVSEVLTQFGGRIMGKDEE